jgi:hypothetical protein
MSEQNQASWGPNPEYAPPMGRLASMVERLRAEGADDRTIYTITRANNIEGTLRYFDAAKQLAGKNGDANQIFEGIKNDPNKRAIADEVIAGWNRNIDEEAAKAQKEHADREREIAQGLAAAARELVQQHRESPSGNSIVSLDPSVLDPSNFNPAGSQAGPKEKIENESFENHPLDISPDGGVIDISDAPDKPQR